MEIGIRQIIIISIHALRKECDLQKAASIFTWFIFLSTHSVRSATLNLLKMNLILMLFLSTHSVRSATLVRHRIASYSQISIHALRKECDQI